MQINRQQILISLLDNIWGIADKEYQKRVWIRGEGPEVDDFDETVCNFFQDGEGVLAHYRDFGIADDQYHILMNFRDEFHSFIYSTKIGQQFRMKIQHERDFWFKNKNITFL